VGRVNMLQARSVLKREVSSWEGVSVHPHPFAAQEYRCGRAEVGHVHLWGNVDIPFPRAICDLLVEQKPAERHRRVGSFAKWLRGLDLNQRPLGYERRYKRSFNELHDLIGSVIES
jgi:hypothetical protein